MFQYLPVNKENEMKMLKEMGLSSVDQLFSGIPEELILDNELSLPKRLSEHELKKHMNVMAGKNKTVSEQICFLGAGAYDRYIPSVISHLVSRSEFYTAYTPYQPEISQGTLQAIFEFQSMIAELMGMDVANASLYDGASACAEAALLAAGYKKKRKILISDTVHPDTKSVVVTYAGFNNIELVPIKMRDGVTDKEDLMTKMSNDVGGVIIQSPNFFGQMEDIGELSEIVHREKSLMISSVLDPLAYVLMEPPGLLGSDIVVGEGQSFGLKLNFGGPYLGFMCSTESLMRKLPGRIVGETTDVEGNRAFVLTLQTREQHIRREKATSNICTNQGLNALSASIYMSTLGQDGLAEAAGQSISKTQYAIRRFSDIGIKPYFGGPLFEEFVIDLKTDATVVFNNLSDEGILCGLPLGKFPGMIQIEQPENKLLVCVTEKRTGSEIDNLVDAIGRVVR